MDIEEELFKVQDKQYAVFQHKLIPNLKAEAFIGVRVPICRKLAKIVIADKNLLTQFFTNLPHKYYDEDLLHALLIAEIKDFDECIDAIEKFLPFVNNWAVCDLMSPKVFKKNKLQLMQKINIWSSSSLEYTVRFGLEMLMTHFLDDDFSPEYLKIPAQISSEKYYVQMMQAWFFATALAKQWESTLPYLLKNLLSREVHQKTIQKAIESFRITPEQKNYLKSLR